jgi:hypothetical protein
VRGVASTTPLGAGAADEPRWQDVLNPIPDVLIVLRPVALRRDDVYGPLLRRVLDLARRRRQLVTATRTIDVIESTEEMMLAVREERGHHEDGLGLAPLTGVTSDPGNRRDFVVVLRGVRQDLDPASLVDDDGSPLWAPGPPGRVRELVHPAAADGASETSLFELSGRTWVVASGPARARTRDTFDGVTDRDMTQAPGPPDAERRGTSRGTSPVVGLNLDPAALVWARLSGPTLVAHVGVLRPPALLAPVGQDLAAVTVALAPGTDAVLRATFAYKGERAAAAAEATLRQAFRAISERKLPCDCRGGCEETCKYAWLGASAVARGARTVVVTAPLPKALVAALVLRAGGRDSL